MPGRQAPRAHDATTPLRVHEVGVRMALGARGTDVLALVLWQALRLAGMGLLLGMAGALALSRVMRGLVFGISALDPTTFVVGPTILVGTALLAGYLPARRAAAVQPVEALRAE